MADYKRDARETVRDVASDTRESHMSCLGIKTVMRQSPPLPHRALPHRTTVSRYRRSDRGTGACVQHAASMMAERDFFEKKY